MRTLLVLSALATSCAPKPRPPVTTTQQLAHALCEPLEPWESCLRRCRAASSAEAEH